MDEVTRNALVLRVNAHIRGAFSVAQSTRNVDEEVDIAQHYAVDVPVGSLPIDVINNVVAEFAEVGWTFSQYIAGKIVLARTEIYVEKGRPAFSGESTLVCTIPEIISGRQYSSSHVVTTPVP